MLSKCPFLICHTPCSRAFYISTFSGASKPHRAWPGQQSPRLLPQVTDSRKKTVLTFSLSSCSARQNQSSFKWLAVRALSIERTPFPETAAPLRSFLVPATSSSPSFLHLSHAHKLFPQLKPWSLQILLVILHLPPSTKSWLCSFVQLATGFLLFSLSHYKCSFGSSCKVDI